MDCETNTIAAIATAPGRAGVAVIRVSGDGAFAVCKALTGRAAAPGRIRRATVRGDDCVVLAFRSPRSYTGEDVVEFQCHGGAVAPRRVLEACLGAGARLARRGEFTERAFLNGKLALEAAESVIDLIDAKTDRAAEAALAGFGAARTREVRTLYDAAVEVSSVVEHALDVDEGDLPPDFLPDVRARLVALARATGRALRRLREGRMLRDGARVVLAGPPNAGKSSLFNALVGENRVLVSPTPGTTRDAIEAWLDIDGWPVRLIDTAGLRDAADAVEAEGVRRAHDLIAQADLVLMLDDGDVSNAEAQRRRGELFDCLIGGSYCKSNDQTTNQSNNSLCASAPLRLEKNPSFLLIRSKCDLDAARADAALRVSAKTGEGLDALRRAIADALDARADDATTDAQEGDRFHDALVRAAREVAAAQAAADDLVLVGNAVRRAATLLGEAIGAEYSADLLDRLFSRFCVGK